MSAHWHGIPNTKQQPTSGRHDSRDRLLPQGACEGVLNLGPGGHAQARALKVCFLSPFSSLGTTSSRKGCIFLLQCSWTVSWTKGLAWCCDHSLVGWLLIINDQGWVFTSQDQTKHTVELPSSLFCFIHKVDMRCLLGRTVNIYFSSQR